MLFLYYMDVVLNFEALNLKEKIILLRNLKITGKGNKERVVPVVPFVEDCAAKYLDLCPFKVEKNDFLFLGIQGNQLAQELYKKKSYIVENN